MKHFIDYYNEQSILNEDENILVEMSNLRANETGLPVAIYVSLKGNSKHAARIKVGDNPNKWTGKYFSLTIEDNPKIIGNMFLKNKELNQIKQFVIKNKKALLDHWNDNISSMELFKKLK